ncbi:hypothetical protein PF005_g2054 [Phytophthora fragariae]|uniref:Uncharacterized protein n=1 Tax=Phytophthora fragariae TaxID=53985 RepID=A0A6A3MD60_9STRA|nr:hypothetical protein PF003_g2433 [Phytophthora fragariae]KAE8948271.1 hypothetical protein PF009_g2171 [Phytophthora fragariae]KAE9030281.1 hypothetical protein PF011_g674 [Phytophthora fragariae]KAE9134649.1 hypothetical protein PF010_g2389 [Phytophthora fragariae]KAE9136764.1 hypothetical protein PF007_g2070 [Phytophthora fragariae]
MGFKRSSLSSRQNCFCVLLSLSRLGGEAGLKCSPCSKIEVLADVRHTSSLPCHGHDCDGSISQVVDVHLSRR